MSRFVAVFALAWASGGFISVDARAAQELPEALKNVGITEKLGQNVSIRELRFRDEAGHDVALADYFSKGRPVLLSLVYYGCPTLCTYVLNAVVDSLKPLQWTPGREFEVVTVSIDPAEGPELAARKKGAYMKSYGRAGAADGWHFLTGSKEAIATLAGQVGFGFEYDAKTRQFAHGAALMVLTPEGRVSRYLYGVMYPERDLRLALLEASSGRIGTIVDRILMFCYRYDPSARGYALYAFRLVQAGSALMLVLFGGYLLVFWRRERRDSKKGGLA